MDVDANLSEVPVNVMPLIDATDFKTIEDAVTYNQAGMALFWNFVTTAGAFSSTAVTPTSGGAYDWTDQGTSGMYTIEIPASGGASINNDTEGYGWFTGSATGVLPWRGPVIGFRAAALNNALCDGGDTLDVNVTTITDTAQTGRDLGASVLLSSGTGTGQISLSSGAVLLQATQTGVTIPTVTTVTNAVSANVTQISGDSTAADNCESFFDGTGYAGTNNVIPTVTTLTNAPSDSSGVTTLLTRTPNAVPGAVGGLFIAGSNAATTVNITGNITGNLSGTVGSVTGAVGSVSGNVTGSIGSLATQAKADVNAEMVDVLATDTYAELAAVPAATSTLKDKIVWLFMQARNKMTQTSTTTTLRNDADDADVSTSTVAKSSGTVTRGEWS